MTAKTTTARKATPAARKARHARIIARGTFGLGLAVSLVANVAASDHTAAGIATGLWAPVALLLALLLLEGGAVKGWAAQWGVGALAAIAGWSSYWHLVEIMDMAGVHDPIAKYLMPLTVDVLMALASPGMKAKTAARRRTARKTTATRKLRAV